MPCSFLRRGMNLFCLEHLRHSSECISQNAFVRECISECISECNAECISQNAFVRFAGMT